MELNRRNFILSIVGGVAGIHLTPLPWKLMDDSAIWTQNWPWVPVPPTGEFMEVKSVCGLCPGACGIKVRKVDDRAVKIEGRTDYPINPGGICPVGMGGLQLLYNKSIRYTQPMKRVGARGKGQFIGISWDEALGMLADRITSLRETGSPEAIAAVDGNRDGSTVSLMVERLLQAIGSPNYINPPSIDDTCRIGNILMQGTETPMAYDLENSDFILSFGAGLLEGWGAPGRIMNAWNLWHDYEKKKKTEIVQIESRASNSASKADQWIAPRPGTEAALALGLAHVIIKEGLYNTEFIEKHSFGFNDWSSADGKKHIGFKTMVLNRYSPDQVAKITGLNSTDIISLAVCLVKAKAPVVIYGKGKDELNGGMYEFMAVHTLNALLGRINRQGGVLIHDPLPLNPLPEIKLDALARSGLKRSRIDGAGSMDHPFTKSLINNLAESVNNSAESPVDTLLVFSANPAFTLPDGGAFKKALKKIPFVVSFSPFKDETSYMADLILPDHTYLEKMDDIVRPGGLQYPFYGLSKPVVKPLYNTMSSGDAVIRLAKKIGRTVGEAFPWHKYEDVLKLRAKGLFACKEGLVDYDASKPAWRPKKNGAGRSHQQGSFKDMWKKLKSEGLWYRPVNTHKNWDGLFKTPTGKFEFFSTQIELAIYDYAQKTSEKSVLDNMGITVGGDESCMPHYESIESDVDRSAYPLLMLPFNMINLASGWVPSPPFLYTTLFDNQLLRDESFCWLNPETAAEYGLKQGSRVIIKSTVGEAQGRITVFEGAMPGIVYLPLGLGHTAYDEFIRGKGINPNGIIDAGKDPVSGLPVWWNTPVKLIKV